MLPCDICGKAGHSWFACPDRSKKPEGWKPDRLCKTASSPSGKASGFGPDTAGSNPAEASILHPSPKRLKVGLVGGGRNVGKVAAIAKVAKDLRAKGVKVVDLNAPIIDIAPKRGRGRPASIDDMKAYKAAKQREYRADRKRRAAQKEAGK